MSGLPQRDLITTTGQRIVKDCSALTDELKLREDDSDPIKSHPELNCASSRRPGVCDQNIFINFGHEHANAPRTCIQLWLHRIWKRLDQWLERFVSLSPSHDKCPLWEWVSYIILSSYHSQQASVLGKSIKEDRQVQMFCKVVLITHTSYSFFRLQKFSGVKNRDDDCR